MLVAHQLRQLLLLHMGVDLRRRDVGMPQQFLDDAQVGPAFEQVAGEGMPQHVRRYFLRVHARVRRQPLKQQREKLPRDVPPAAVGRKQPRTLFRLQCCN